MQYCPHCRVDSVKVEWWCGNWKQVCTKCGCKKTSNNQYFDGNLPMTSIFCKEGCNPALKKEESEDKK